jgi:hypothetical protein
VQRLGLRDSALQCSASGSQTPTFIDEEAPFQNIKVWKNKNMVISSDGAKYQENCAGEWPAGIYWT